MKIKTSLRIYIRHYPRLKSYLIPIYEQIMHIGWLIHNLSRYPIVFNAGQNSLKLYPDGHIPKVLYSGNFEATDRDFVEAYLKPGMTVIDAGANVGLYSLMSSVLIGTNGKVHAFEPGRLSFERLLRNLHLNRCKNVVATHKALSNTSEPMVLRVDPTHPSLDSHRFVQSLKDVIHPTSTDEIVDCVKLDDYFLQKERVIDFMKIDVEGAEMAILQGAEKTLSCSPDVTILLECSQNRKQVWDLLMRHGFKCFVWDCICRELKPVDFHEAVLTSIVIYVVTIGSLCVKFRRPRV